MAERVFTQTFGVVGAIIEQSGKILLVKENDPTTWAFGKWNQPAGWIDVSRNPINEVVKEVKEETGLDFEPTGVLGIYSLVKHHPERGDGVLRHAIKIIFKGKIIGGELIRNTQEISEVRWFSLEEIMNMDADVLRDIDIKQEAQDYFAGWSFPLDIIRHTVHK